jgi:hypothetical protein
MKYLFFLAVSLCLFSCSSNDGAPSGIIGRSRMETILWQLMQVDEFTANAFVRDTVHNLTTERIRRYRRVFELNQTTKDEFEKSYKYYMAHPDISKVMFDSISARANRQRDDSSHPPPVNTPPVTKPKPVSNATMLQQLKPAPLAPHK